MEGQHRVVIKIASRGKDASNLAERPEAVGRKVEHAVDDNEIYGLVADTRCKQVGWVSLDETHMLPPGIARPVLLGRKLFCNGDFLR